MFSTGSAFGNLNLSTVDLSLTMGAAQPPTDPYFPVRCNANDPFAGPCTIPAGGSYSATYTNLTEAGMTLNYGGSTYVLGGGSCANCFAVPWQLTLIYVPQSSFTYGQLNAAAVSAPYAVTGSLTVGSPSGVGFLLNNYQMTGAAIGSARLVTGPPGSNALQLGITFSSPEPGSLGFVVVGLASVVGLRRRGKLV